ncbi:MAG TPA: hypothetical protein VF483_13275 [Gemmatimonadaceae bacterium]
MMRYMMALVLTAASTAVAQVGYDPGKSPYRDLDRSQEITVTSGQMRASSDPAHVAPQTGAWLGLKYQWLVAGPTSVTAEIARVGSERRVLDPLLPATCTGANPADCKLLRTYRWPIYFADVGLALNLTGARTYHSLIPEVRGGLGMITDFHSKGDVGDFAVGTQFALSYGTGIKWVPGGRYQFRFDLGDRLYQIHYPESYFTRAPDGSYVRQPSCPVGVTSSTDPSCRGAKRSAWIHNGTFTIGLSYLFGTI